MNKVNTSFYDRNNVLILNETLYIQLPTFDNMQTIL